MNARALIAILVLASFTAVAQAPSPPTGLPKGINSKSPKEFFEIANKNFLLKKELVIPKPGLPMVKLTEFDDLDAVRTFSATADVEGLGAANDPISKMARTKLRQIVNDKTLANVRLV